MQAEHLSPLSWWYPFVCCVERSYASHNSIRISSLDFSVARLSSWNLTRLSWYLNIHLLMWLCHSQCMHVYTLNFEFASIVVVVLYSSWSTTGTVCLLLLCGRKFMVISRIWTSQDSILVSAVILVQTRSDIYHSATTTGQTSAFWCTALRQFSITERVAAGCAGCVTEAMLPCVQ